MTTVLGGRDLLHRNSDGEHRLQLRPGELRVTSAAPRELGCSTAFGMAMKWTVHAAIAGLLMCVGLASGARQPTLPLPPDELYGPLFADVQRAAIFPDAK